MAIVVAANFRRRGYGYLSALPMALLSTLSGCVSNTPINPSFPICANDARRVLTDATATPKPLSRPLVIVGGFNDWNNAASNLTRDFGAYTHDQRVIGVSLDFATDFDEFRRRIITAVDKAFPSGDPQLTTDVDVIGVSMGGVAARYAALAQAPGRRLQIHRLFTISSPHMGCSTLIFALLPLVSALENLRPGSPFLEALNNSPDLGAAYPIYPYVCLDDELVGEAYCAPPRQQVWWISGPPFLSHHWAWHDPRIRADILRRLRDEVPLATDPPARLPEQLENFNS